MEYLKIWTSFREIIEPLNDDERGRLFSAMLEYADSETVPELEGNERFVWPIAKQTIDRARLESLKQTANGNKGGRPRKPTETQENPEKPNETQMNPEEPKETLKDKVNINIKENPLKGIKEKTLTRFSAPSVEEVEAYCKERGNSVDARRFVDFYSSKGWKVGNTPMKDWRAAVRTWEKRDSSPAPVKVLNVQNYSQRNYSSGVLSDLADGALREARAKHG